MRVAVTGASGFVGRHVVRELAARPGLSVVATGRGAPPDDLPPGFDHVVRDHAAPSPGDYDRLGRPELLIHLAWAGLPHYQSTHHFETELPAQFAFLKSLVAAGLPRMLVTGTCYEYGMRCGELNEAMPAEPVNAYAHAKDALRRQLEFLRASSPFGLTWARLFYMYGEGQAATSLYALLRAAALRGDRVFPMSKGEQLRDFLPATEVARLIVDLALADGSCGTLVNICSGQPVSIRSLVERWQRDNGWDLRLELGKYPYPAHEPLAFWGSTDRLHRQLNSATTAN